MAPVQRVTGFDSVMPLARLEKQYMPSAERIADAARQAIGWSG